MPLVRDLSGDSSGADLAVAAGLAFLKEHLRTKVRPSDAPAVLVHHYGLDAMSTNEWNWWTPKQRKAYYDAIRPYNIVAIIHGHDHHAAHYRWPDPQQNPEEVRRVFGEAPADPRSYDVFSCGELCCGRRLTRQRRHSIIPYPTMPLLGRRFR